MIAFMSQYMMFDGRIEPYQRADDVGYAISEFLWFEERPFYPASALAQAKVAQVNLCSLQGSEDNQDNCDLVFQMPKADGGHFYEIVMRSDNGTAYGGWAWGETLECLDQIANGYRVLRTQIHETQASFEYSSKSRRYGPTSKLLMDKKALRPGWQSAMIKG
ncbi:hypothetical protein [Rhizobium glycinendophyticum]|uniref:Uncharacterized protein n=1 Tax=Rhizobium glycinendophyticum TaxID=2589807 RepID=A0A504U7J0_9HYPH|nr:hypothetical protein [Rhizobium glycinendophyticum]TPP05866.1 hypothetical protein FJQ55_19190 [Rhizobium glycinendophyticum]